LTHPRKFWNSTFKRASTAMLQSLINH